jgi:5-methylcytosine-specific restriction endonuclease McrA
LIKKISPRLGDLIRKVNPIGQKFGRLTIQEKLTTSEITSYLCQCDCGKSIVARWGNIQSGTTRSCGCLRKEVIRNTKLKPAEEVLVKQVRSYYKRNAQTRNIYWELTDIEVGRLILAPCFYCGITGGTETILVGSKRTIRNNGIDRLDNTKSYTTENSVSCCKNCNLAKHEQTLEEFKEWIKRLVEYGYLFHE